jgi:DNA invertase Pin-like site-specific DNA recombinase
VMTRAGELRGHGWVPKAARTAKRARARRVPDDVRSAVRSRLDAGDSVRDIVDGLGVSRSVVYRIVRAA